MLLPQAVDESQLAGESATDYVRRVACAKARAGWQDRQRRFDLPVLAADTTVVCEAQVLGKPASLPEARQMLQLLSARSHQVLTAIAVAQGARVECEVVVTEVIFRTITADEIDAYWQCGEPQDKAGAYGIQGKGALFVTGVRGSYSNVVGLPLFETTRLLEQFGISTLALLQEQAA